MLTTEVRRQKLHVEIISNRKKDKTVDGRNILANLLRIKEHIDKSAKSYCFYEKINFFRPYIYVYVIVIMNLYFNILNVICSNL